MTRRKITAFTFRVTLSRVMMSCGGTSRASWRSEIRTMRSTGTNTRMIPGPLAFGSSRPRRKITPRSYSRRILIELTMYRTTIITRMTGREITRSLPQTELKCAPVADYISFGSQRITNISRPWPASAGFTIRLAVYTHAVGADLSSRRDPLSTATQHAESFPPVEPVAGQKMAPEGSTHSHNLEACDMRASSQARSG